MSFSSAGLKLTTTLLLYLPLESSRTDVTPQKIACSGPLSSLLPQIVVAFVRWCESRPADPPTVTLSMAFGWSHLENGRQNHKIGEIGSADLSLHHNWHLLDFLRRRCLRWRRLPETTLLVCNFDWCRNFGEHSRARLPQPWCCKLFATRIYDSIIGNISRRRQLTFGIVKILDGDGEGSLNRDLVLKDGRVLMGCEFPFADRFSLKRERLVAELLNAILESQFVIVNAREVLAVQLPSVDKLFWIVKLNYWIKRKVLCLNSPPKNRRARN